MRDLQDELSLPALQAALRRTTERLAYELATPAERAPDWSANDWLVAQAVASIHGVSGLLVERLRWSGPPAWDGFLREQRLQIALRQQRILGLLQQIDRQARARGVALVALKGASLQARGLYAPGERPMADIDLLVSAQAAAPAAQLFLDLGFRAGPVTWKHRVFEPPAVPGEVPADLGESRHAPIKVELHSQVREILPLRPVDISDLVLTAGLPAGVNDYPATAALLLHVLLHAAGTMIGRSLRLLHLSDIARLARVMTPAD